MRMKQLLAIALSLLLILSFVGCDRDEGEKAPSESGETIADSTDSTATPEEGTARDTYETTDTKVVDPPEVESETQTGEIIGPEDPSGEVSDTLNTVFERLLTGGGVSLTVDGKLSMVTYLFGMQVITDMPLSLSLMTAANGLSVQAEIPMAGAYGLTLTDGRLYLSDAERKYYCELLGAEDDTAVPTLPKWDEEEQATILERMTELIDQLTSGIQMEIDPLTGSVTVTVSLSEGAAKLAEELRATMEEWEAGADSETGGDDIENLALALAWLDTVAASPDAKLVFTAALDGENASVSLSLFCPFDMSLLLSLLPKDDTDAGSTLPSDMSSTGDLSLTITLRCGQMSVTAPEDAEDYTLTDWQTIKAAIESALDALPSRTKTPSETVPVTGM